MKIFYFTSTGNSLNVAKNFDAELISIPQAIKEGNFNYSDNKIGFIFPTYNFSVPRIVVEFIEKLQITSPYIFVIAVHAGTSMGVLNHFISLAEKRDIKVDYATTITTHSNYLPLSDMTKVISKTNTNTINKNIKEIVTDINSNIHKIDTKNFLISGISSLTYKMVSKLPNKNHENFSIDNNCTLCSVCAKSCPIKNITVDETVNYDNKCMFCLACTHACPQNSIRVKKEKSTKRYRNENVTLEEIIYSNNQL